MPAQRGKSPFDFNKSIQGHAGDATEIPQDFSRLPGGIGGGVARLISAAIGTYKKGDNEGEKFVRLAGKVEEPEYATETTKVWKDNRVEVVSSRERRIKGLQTSVMFPMCDTTKADGSVVSADENVSDMMNNLRLLGLDTNDMKDEADLDARLKALTEAAPAFRFSTRQSDPTAKYPEPRVFETWYGTDGLDGYVPGAVAPGTDNSPPAGSPPSASPPAEPEANLDDLAGLADGEDEAAAEPAREELTKRARAVGIVDADINKAPSWAKVVELIGQAAAPAGDTKGGDKPWEPEKGQVYGYTITNTRTKKKKKVEVKVTTVDKKSKTVELLDVDDRKTVYKDVKWDDLEDA